MRPGSILALLLLPILAWTAGPSRLPAAPASPAPVSPASASLPPGLPLRTLVCFGDSLTAGYGLDDPADEAYPALIGSKIEAADLPWRVVNAGLSGETTSGGLRRVNWILRGPTDLVVLELGANDALRGLPLASIEANLQGIIDRIRAVHPATVIVLAGMRMPASLGPGYAQGFAAIYPGLARRNHLPLIPFLLAGAAGIPSLNQADGIHPTARGHALLAANAWAVIQPLLARTAPAGH